MKEKRYWILPFVSIVHLEDAYKKITVLSFGTRSKSLYHTFKTKER